MVTEDELNKAAFTQDIAFECGACGKSLVINALGAGLAITCPACGAELEVPSSGGGESPIPKAHPLGVAEIQKAEQELPEISEVLADAREQISALKSEIDELQVRRKFLEKRHALTSQGLQLLRQETIHIRTALDKVDTLLKSLEDPHAGDTQPVA